MARYNNNNRLTPDAITNYDLNPVAAVVDKQSKYTPQLGDAAKLKNTAQGLVDLAKGVTAINIQLARMSEQHTAKAYMQTEEENKAKFAEVSKKIDGFGKFNPYNREVYHTLRADSMAGNAQLKYKELAANCELLTPEEFDTQVYNIQTELLNNLKAENIKAKNSANALTGFQNTQAQLKNLYVIKKAERDQVITHNAMVTATAKTFATNAYNKDIDYLEGWNDSVKRLTETANGLGINNSKQYELFIRSVNQYLADNIDDIDVEEFMIAVGQTTINGQPLSDFDPNYATSMQTLLKHAKRTKYEADSIDFQMENLRLNKAKLAAHADLFKTAATGDRTAIKNKAYELIEEYGMEGIGMDFIQSIVQDQRALLALETTETNPQIYDELIRKQLTNELTQEDILNAVTNKQLGARDANALFSALESDAREIYAEQYKTLKELYLDTKPLIELEDDDKTKLSKMVFETSADPNLSKSQKAQALKRARGIAEHMANKSKMFKEKNPMNLLSSDYMATQKVRTQDIQKTQRSLAYLGLLKNQAGWKDSNIKVSSTMQEEREVTLSDGTKVKRPHFGSDISTYLGRQIYAPMTGKVIASGTNPSMGNYVLFECQGKGYIKLMHLQQTNLPKAGTYLLKGQPLAYVGNTGSVETKDKGTLHVECFNKQMRLVDPTTFIKGS